MRLKHKQCNWGNLMTKTQHWDRLWYLALMGLLALPIVAYAQDETVPSDPLLAVATDSYQDGDYLAAVGFLAAGAANNSAVHLLRARAFWQLEDYDQLITDCTTVIEADPSASAAAQCYAMRGAAYALQQADDSARADLVALDAHPQAEVGHLWRGSLLNALGEQTEGAASFQRYMQAMGTPVATEQILSMASAVRLTLMPNTVYQLSISAMSDQVLSLNAASLSAQGTDVVVLLLDAQGQAIIGDDLGGTLAGDARLNEIPLMAANYTLWVAAGDGRAGGEVLINWLQLDAQDYLINCDLAFDENRYDDAQLACQRAIDLGVSDVFVYAALASTYYMQNEHEQAIEALNSAIELQPNAGRLYLSRAVNYAELGNYDQAMADVQRGFELGVTDEGAYLSRAIVYSLMGDQQQAAEDYLVWVNANSSQAIQLNLEDGQRLVQMSSSMVYALRFDGETGQAVVIRAVASPETADVDPLIVLLAPDGTPLAGDDDELTLPTTGRYILLVTHAGGGTTGDILVTVEQVG
jgi:tetratricopeptide (TPR) repeat protein